jgi:hypothetical protein
MVRLIRGDLQKLAIAQQSDGVPNQSRNREVSRHGNRRDFFIYKQDSGGGRLC